MSIPKISRVLITGVSSGIGLAIATRLISEGYEVWGTSRTAERLKSIEGIRAVALDLNSDESIQSCWDIVLKQMRGVDAVINNAGSGYFGSVEDMPMVKERELMNTLLHGPMLLNRLAVKHFRQQGKGLLINVTSVAGEFPMPFMSCYSAAKAALICYTESLRLELSGESIQVVDIKPGDIQTNFNDMMPKALEKNDDPYQARMIKAWDAIDRNMKNAPKADLVAKVVLKAIRENGKKQDYYAGDFFQTVLTSFANRILPRKVIRFALKLYYGLPL